MVVAVTGFGSHFGISEFASKFEEYRNSLVIVNIVTGQMYITIHFLTDAGFG